MKLRRPHVLVVLVSLAACGDPAGPEADVAEVRVSPEGTSTDVGLTVQFTARAINATGQTVTGLSVTWTSSSESVATIDEMGIATALAVGTTAIQATIGAQSQSQVLTVQPSQCTNRVRVVLSPGDFQTYAANQCLLLPAGQAGDVYRVAVARPTQIADSMDVPAVTLRTDPILVAAAAPIAVPPQVTSGINAAPALAGRLRGIDGSGIVGDMETVRRTRRFHHELRERERMLRLETLPALPNLANMAPALTNHPDPPSRADMMLDLDCSTSVQSPVRLIDFNDDVAIYQDSVEWSMVPLTTAATGQMLSYYTDYTRDMISDYFGEPSDTDGNQRIIVVTSPSLSDGAAAAVYSGDFVSTNVCAGSNEGEVIYFDQDVIANLVDPDPSYLALSVLAHELKHVVSIYHAVRRGAFHPTWMEEGRAEIAQILSSRIAWAATGGPAVGAEVDGTDIIEFVNANNNRISPEMWGVIGGLADLIVSFSTQPNSLITDPVGSHEFHTFYASSFHWHRFVGDAYGDASTPFADGPLFKALTDSGTVAGVPGLTQQTGRSFDQLFEDVVVAASTHKATSTTAANGFTTWDFRSASQIFASPPDVAPLGSYPYPVTTDLEGNLTKGFVTGAYSCPLEWVGSDDTGSWVAPDATDRCPIGPSGVRFHDFRSGGVGLGVQILVTGAGSNGKIIVTRLN